MQQFKTMLASLSIQLLQAFRFSLVRSTIILVQLEPFHSVVSAMRSILHHGSHTITTKTATSLLQQARFLVSVRVSSGPLKVLL